MTPCKTDSIADSSNLACSPTVNLFAFKYTKLTVFDVRLTTWPIARLSFPTTFSPTITFVLRLRPLTKVNLSNTGVDVFLDSYTATTLTTSGTLRDISSSSTLNP